MAEVVVVAVGWAVVEGLAGAGAGAAAAGADWAQLLAATAVAWGSTTPSTSSSCCCR